MPQGGHRRRTAARVAIYIYIYIERERERVRDVYTHIYIYIFDVLAPSCRNGKRGRFPDPEIAPRFREVVGQVAKGRADINIAAETHHIARIQHPSSYPVLVACSLLTRRAWARWARSWEIALKLYEFTPRETIMTCHTTPCNVIAPNPTFTKYHTFPSNPSLLVLHWTTGRCITLCCTATWPML